MSEKLIKESQKVFMHMAGLFYEIKMNTLKEVRPDEAEMLMEDDAFMDSIYKDCIKNASVKMVDKEVVLITLRVNHKRR